MNDNSISRRLRQVAVEVFGVDESRLPAKPSQIGIKEWDSLGHLRLIMAIESEFYVRFPIDKIPEMTSFEGIEIEIINASR